MAGGSRSDCPLAWRSFAGVVIRLRPFRTVRASAFSTPPWPRGAWPALSRVALGDGVKVRLPHPRPLPVVTVKVGHGELTSETLRSGGGRLNLEGWYSCEARPRRRLRSFVPEISGASSACPLERPRPVRWTSGGHPEDIRRPFPELFVPRPPCVRRTYSFRTVFVRCTPRIGYRYPIRTLWIPHASLAKGL